MEAPVDLANLRDMIDGDKEMEKALFEEFFSSFEAGIAALQSSSGDAEAWRKEAHALKGVALNLGAQTLGELCKNAQEAQHDPEKTKAAMVATIRAEYEQVKTFLQGLC